jgi:hypothetical protein
MAEPGRQMFPVLAKDPFETWEVAVTPLPLWLPVEGRRARAWLALCLNTETEKTLASEPGAEEEIPRMLDQVLALAARRWRTRPAQVRVADAELARLLERPLSPQEVPVEVAELLVLPEVVESLVAGMVPPDPRPGPLTGDGVTEERLRSFARAAAGFYVSSCWRHLSNEDLVQVEAPEVEEARRYFVIHHQGSRPAGFWFFPDRQSFEDLVAGESERFMTGGKRYWTIGFDLPWSAPPDRGR